MADDDKKTVNGENLNADATATEQDLPVEVVLEGEDDAEVRHSQAEESDDDEDDVQKSLKKLRKKLEKEKQARIEAEERARLASEKLNSAYNDVEDTNLQLISGAIDTVKRENEYLKSEYRSALTNSDFDRAAEIQEAMATNAAKLLQLENGKQQLQNRPKQQAPNYSDPVEQFAAQLSPRSADWIRKNPQCVTDPRLQQKMIAAHNLAIADGFAPDSDDYFGFIEETLKINRRKDKDRDDQQEDSPLSSASKPVSRQAPPPAAPPNRGTTRPNVVRLTRAEADTARMLGMSEKEYAQHKIALQKEGKLPN